MEHADQNTETSVQVNLSNRIRAFFTESKGFRIRELGFEFDLKGGKDFRFPYPAVDWNSVMLTSQSGDYYREPFIGKSLLTGLSFKEPQQRPIHVGDFSRFRCQTFTNQDDLPCELAELFSKTPPHAFNCDMVPVLLPIYDFDKNQSTIEGDYEMHRLPGCLAFYLPESPDARARISEATATVASIMNEETSLLESHGIREFKITGSEYHVFGTLAEGLLNFSALIRLDTQEDRYWHMVH